MYDALTQIDRDIVSKSFPLPDGGCITLLAYDKIPPVKAPITNLMRFDEYGKRIWFAEAIENNDIFVYASLDGQNLFASTWSCYAVQLDLETGHIMTRVFTK